MPFDPNAITAASYGATALTIAWLFATTPQLNNVRALILFIGVFTTCGLHHAWMVPLHTPPMPLEWTTAVFSMGGAIAILSNLHRIKDAIASSNACELANAELTESRERWRKLFQHSAIGIALVGLDGQWLETNDRLSEIVGYSKAELSDLSFQQITHPEDLSMDMELYRELLSGERDWYQLEKRYLRKDKSSVWILLVAAILRGFDGEPLYFVSQVLDVDQRKKSLEILEQQNLELRLLKNRLEFQAKHDSMTGLLNRSGFLEAMDEAIADPDVPDLCLLFLDLDGLKQVNDTMGHLAGDRFIRESAQALERHCDISGRIRGGDEFAGLLYCTIEDAAEAAQRVLKDIQGITLRRDDNTALRGGASLGLVPVSNTGSMTQSDIEALADAALYKAKHGGKNRLEILYPDSPEFLDSRIKANWIQKIAAAIDADTLIPYCQELQPLSARDDCSYCEALVRYRDGDRIVPAAEFIGALSGNPELMRRLDRWMLRKVCSIPHKHREIAVNLSGATLSDASFVGHAIAVFKDTGFDPKRIHFEITEQMAIRIEDALRVLDGLRSLGCKIALDDTGTGFSSLTYILELNPDVIKVDGSFVRQVVERPGVPQQRTITSRALVMSLMHLANMLGKELICEYVEDEAVEAQLIHMRNGVSSQMRVFGQGWLYGKPGPC